MSSSALQRGTKFDIAAVADVEARVGIHSDGTGLIEKSLMTKIVEKLPFAPSDAKAVSIIQVRIGGAKGTLTSWQFSDLKAFRSTSPITSICIRRPSSVDEEVQC